MLKEQSKLIIRIHKLWDICLTAAAFIGAFFIKKYILPVPFRGLIIGPNYHVVLLMIIIIWYGTFELRNLYASYRNLTFGQILWDMIKAVCIGMFIIMLCMYIFKIENVSRIMIGIFFLLDIVLLAISKGLIYKVSSRYHKKDYSSQNILIIGSKDRANDVIDAIRSHSDSGFRILGCLDLDPAEIGKQVKNGVEIIGTIDNLKKIMLEEVVDELIFAMPLKRIENPKNYISIAEKIGITVRIIPDWQIYKLIYNPGIAQIYFEEYLGLPTLALKTTPQKHRDLLIKSIFDYLSAGISIIMLLSLFLLISCAIKFSSRGPVLFKQERCGLNGRRFMFFKFRTMVTDAEARRQELDVLNEADGPVFKIKKDPRIIPFVGTLIRKTGLDELPQLINVLRGEMSIVGPRPPIPAEVKNYDDWQRRRLSMKPGLTCLWQITPNRNEVSFKEWMNMDLAYIDNWSLVLDFKILLKTIWVVLTGAGR